MRTIAAAEAIVADVLLATGKWVSGEPETRVERYATARAVIASLQGRGWTLVPPEDMR